MYSSVWISLGIKSLNFLNFPTYQKFIVVVQGILTLQMVWLGVVIFLGLIKKKKPLPQTDKKRRFAVVICAHNEERVIAHLLESLKKVAYPAENLDVFVLADHCTDDTELIASKSATVLRRISGPTHGKGDVLEWGIPKIRAYLKKQHKTIDAFAFFDADNIVEANFFTEMNNMLASGETIIQGNRLGGKPYTNCITKWYVLYWSVYSFFLSYPRQKLGLSAFLTGTGFVVDEKLLQDGWHTKSITEDVEYCIQNNIKGGRVAFNIKAICYDEQPSDIRVMFNQLCRWCTGGYQILKLYLADIVVSEKEPTVRKIDNAMMLLLGPCSWVSTILNLINFYMLSDVPIFLIFTGVFSLFGLVCVYIGVAIAAKINGIAMREIGWLALLTFPFFMFVFMLSSIKSFFAPTLEWKKIEHRALDQVQS